MDSTKFQLCTHQNQQSEKATHGRETDAQCRCDIGLTSGIQEELNNKPPNHLIKKGQRRSSCSGRAETNLARNHEAVVRSLASPSGLRIRRCPELWWRSQMQIGSGIAVAAGWDP